MTAEDVRSGLLTESVQVGPTDANLPSAYTAVQTISPRYDQAYMDRAAIGSPAWWTRRLLAKLDGRYAKFQTWDNYYRGLQPLAFASERFREAFGGRFSAFASNFMALVVDGTRERMEVSGFQMKGTRATKRVWQAWQENDLDAFSQIAHTEALIKSECNVLVAPGRLGDGPRVTVEDALDSIVEHDPIDKRIRRAALKRYIDDDGTLVVWLYLPESIWVLRTKERWSKDEPLTWMPEAMMRNPLGVVPMVSLVNRPRLDMKGQSEIDAVMSNQDAVNKFRADALVAAEYAAFRQRWAIGIDIPTDPTTGQPVDAYKAAVNRLWVFPPPGPDDDPDAPAPKLGEFEATDLEPYQHMIESEIGAIASISRVPYHYLLGQPEAVPPSGESLKSSEAGMIRKVRTQVIHFGESWEEVARLMLLAMGDANGAADRTSETLWKDPETRNEGVRVDATVKAFQAGIIDRAEARVALGYDPGEAEMPAPTTAIDSGVEPTIA